jgi:hypothetical protein
MLLINHLRPVIGSTFVIQTCPCPGQPTTTGDQRLPLAAAVDRASPRHELRPSRPIYRSSIGQERTPNAARSGRLQRVMNWSGDGVWVICRRPDEEPPTGPGCDDRMVMAEVLDLDVGTRIGLSRVEAMRYDQCAPRSSTLPVTSPCQCPSAPRSYSSRSMSAPSPLVSINAAAIPPCEATASGTAYRASHPPALIAASASSSSIPTSWQGMRATTSDRISVRQ